MRVEFNQVIKQFGEKTALNIPEWSLHKGDILGLVGSNGAGKTTFLRILLDLLLPTSGSVRLDGREPSTDASWRARTGSYLDRSFLVEYLTIPEYLQFVGSAFGLSAEETETRLGEYERFLPVSRVDTTRLLRDLSTGNAKKVGILAALFPRPDFVVLDEPFANLDPPSQIRLKEALGTMAAEFGTTMIISSHDLGHVTEICSRITLLDAGEIKRDIATSDETLSELKAFFASDSQTQAT